MVSFFSTCAKNAFDPIHFQQCILRSKACAEGLRIGSLYVAVKGNTVFSFTGIYYFQLDLVLFQSVEHEGNSINVRICIVKVTNMRNSNAFFAVYIS